MSNNIVLKTLKKSLIYLLMVLLVVSLVLVGSFKDKVQAAETSDWLHTQGNQIVDAAGNPVWLTGANWFGYNTSERVFHGLWSANIEELTKSMADRGINNVRVPISTQLILEWRDGVFNPINVNTYANPELTDMNGLEIFDYWLELCEKYGIKVLLDAHSAEADNSGHIYPMWYEGSITPELFYQSWEWITERYKNNDTIIAMDIENEPHGKANESPRAKWDGSTDVDNWKYACETAGKRILAINPHVLILCEGNEIYPKAGETWSSPHVDVNNVSNYHGYWWGGNLRGVRDYPVNLGAGQDQLVYSPHDYGPSVWPQPWFYPGFNKTTLTNDAWMPNWLYIHEENTAPLLIGEWGGHLDGGDNEKWMTALRDLMIEKGIHHTFWCINPNSGDTGGLLLHDFKTWDEEKYEFLKPALWQHGGKFVSLDHQVPLGGVGSTTGISLGDLYGGGTTPDPDPDPTAPAAPTGVTANAGDGQASISWNASSGATSYNVKRSTTSGGAYSTVASNVTSTSYTNTGLTNGTTYYYVVSAVNNAGQSANSSQVSATPQSTVTAPAVPTGVTASAGDGQASISWNASSGATSYNVKRSTTSGGSYTTVASNVTSTSYTNTGLTNGTTYYYVVSASNSAGSSVNSAQVSATPQGGTTTSNLVVQYKAGDTNATDNQIKPHFNIKNNGTSSVNLSTLKLRYYFSKDGSPSMNSWIDWAQIGGSNIQRTFTDTYVELSFTSGAGSIAIGGQTGDIQLRMSKTDWSNFNESNDYSFDPTKTAYANWDHVTLYQNGQLVWGIQP
jgi:endoglucanase